MAKFPMDSDEEQRKRLINDYYLMALHDLKNGSTLEEMRNSLKILERAEHYLECAGIKKAIDLSAFFTTNDLVRYMQNQQSLDDPRIQISYGDKDK
jgi:hypothetical protein